MSFPDVVTEMYTDRWVPISGDVYTRDSIKISRGRRNEGGQVDPSTCALTLNNRDGDYSPRNPLGAHYGDIGRNTPMRVSVRTVEDTFTRSVSSGWGTSDSGHVWTTAGSGGTFLASDFNVAAGVGTHYIDDDLAERSCYMNALAQKDLEVLCTVSIDTATVAGGGIFPTNIVMRQIDTNNRYLMRVSIAPGGAITLGMYKTVAGVTTLIGSEPTLSFTYSGQSLRVRAHIEGSTLRGKVWDVSGNEPLAWQVEQHDDALQAPGAFGIRSEVGSGNTDVPLTFSYDNLEILSPRFYGEVSSWPSRWDLSGRDVSAPVEASGIMRRLGQGASPLRSALRRSIPDLGTKLIAYWPCEEGKRATQVASGIGGLPGTIDYTGYPDWASFDEFAASDPIPVMNNARWDGAIETYTGTGQIQVRMLLHVDEAGSTHLSPLFQLWTTASSATLWEVRYRTGGSLDIVAFAAGSGTPFYTSGVMGFAVDGKTLRLGFWVDQDGANIDWKLETLEPGAAFALAVEDTVSTATVGDAVSVVINPHMNHDNVAIGHVTVENETSTLFDLRQELIAYAGETAGDRISRLCSEEGVPFSYIGDLDETELMGSQLSDTLLDLLHECEAADGGTLFEPRGEIGLAYRTRQSLYNQDPRAVLDYGVVSQPFEPTDDDATIRNDVTVKRIGGSEYRTEQTTGPLSVSSPPTGVGRYDTSVDLSLYTDSQAANAASWLLHLGVVDETRYPTVTVDLASPSAVADGVEPYLLDLSVDDRLTIDGLPAWLPPGTASLLARGLSEEIRPYRHMVTVNASPESPYQVAEFDDGRSLDSDGAKLMASVTSSGTSFSVGRTGDYDEDFEDTSYNVVFSGTWTRTNVTAHAGSWSLRSGVIGDSAQSDCVMTVPDDASTLTFWFSTSSQATDLLRFYVDGVFQGEAGGIVGWTQSATYDVANASTVTFRYVKDASGTDGNDAVYIDDVSFRSASPLWTTTDEPVSLLVGGEEVTATTITGSTSPQTFTVTRSVNGIVKAHSAGAEIALLTPMTLAL